MSEDLPNRDDFEKKLRSESQRFDMLPSDMVWQNINQQLHPQRNFRKPAWLVISLLFLAGASSGLYYYFSAHQKANMPVATVRFSLNTQLLKSLLPAIPAASPGLSSLSSAATQPLDPANTGSRKGEPITISGLSEIKAARPGNTRNMAEISMDQIPTTGIHHNGNPVFPALAGLSSIPSPALQPSGSFIDTSSSIFPGILDLGMFKQKLSFKQLLKHPLKWDFFVVPSISFRWINFPTFNGVTYYYYLQSAFLATPAGLGSGSDLSKNNLYQYSELSFAAGVHVKRSLSGKLNLVSGIEVDRYGYGIHAVPVSPTLVLQSSNTNPGNSSFYNSSYAVPPGPSYNIDLSRQVSINNTYYFVSLPILLNYELPLRNRWKLNISGGTDLGYLVYQQSNILSPFTKVYYTDNNLIRKWEPDLNTSIYISVPFTRNTYFQIGPEFRYQPLSTYIGYQVKEHPYAIGIRLGIGKK